MDKIEFIALDYKNSQFHHATFKTNQTSEQYLHLDFVFLIDAYS